MTDGRQPAPGFSTSLTDATVRRSFGRPGAAKAPNGAGVQKGQRGCVFLRCGIGQKQRSAPARVCQFRGRAARQTPDGIGRQIKDLGHLLGGKMRAPAQQHRLAAARCHRVGRSFAGSGP